MLRIENERSYKYKKKLKKLNAIFLAHSLFVVDKIPRQEKLLISDYVFIRAKLSPPPTISNSPTIFTPQQFLAHKIPVAVRQIKSPVDAVIGPVHIERKIIRFEIFPKLVIWKYHFNNEHIFSPVRSFAELLSGVALRRQVGSVSVPPPVYSRDVTPEPGPQNSDRPLDTRPMEEQSVAVLTDRFVHVVDAEKFKVLLFEVL